MSLNYARTLDWCRRAVVKHGRDRVATDGREQTVATVRSRPFMSLKYNRTLDAYR